MNKLDASSGLLRHGLVVFLLGLATGLAMLVAVDVFSNLRLASELVDIASGLLQVVSCQAKQFSPIDRLRYEQPATAQVFARISEMLKAVRKVTISAEPVSFS
jgi:hypothetical protein